MYLANMTSNPNSHYQENWLAKINLQIKEIINDSSPFLKATNNSVYIMVY